MNALKAQWVVQCGLIPDEDPMEEYTRVWNYTSKDYEADGSHRWDIFQGMAREAHDYAASLQMGGLNWVRVDYLWM